MSDPFSTSTGLIDEYSGTVVESWFGINPQYNENVHLLFWKVELDNPQDFPQLDMGQIQEQFSIGELWESLDGGETVEYPNNPEKRFNANSQYGTIINRAVDWGLRDYLASRGDGPQKADIWVGLRFHFKAEVVGKPFRNRETNELVERKPKVMPVEYLGEGEASQEGAEYDLSALNLTDDQYQELSKTAAESDSFGEFLDAAMKLTWVAESGTVVSALADQSLWHSLRPI